MPINGILYPWNENNVNRAPQDSGVYEFYNRNGVIIYIGSSDNLRERFLGYWKSNFEEDPCKRSTIHYRREVTVNFVQRERELLQEYQRQHGNLPECNDVIP